MSGLILSIFLVAVMLTIFRYPYAGVLLYVWLSTFYPHNAVYGMLLPSPTLLTAVITILSAVAQKGSTNFNRSGVFWMTIIFYLWTVITWMVAMVPDVATERLIDIGKAIIAFAMIVMMTDTKEKLNALVWTGVVSVGAVSAAGLVQTALSGGASQISGIGGPYGGNNEVARLIGVGMGLILFQIFHAGHKLARQACLLGLVSCFLSIVATSSRGAFVAMACWLMYLFLLSRRKTTLMAFGLLALMGAGLILGTTFREQWTARMETIENRNDDLSYQERVGAWNFAIDLTKERPIVGGGYGAFRLHPREDGPGWRDAHSIYFEVLGEHGYVGLGIYVLVMAGTFLRARKIQSFCAKDPRLYWERDLSIVCQLSLIFFAVGGITGSTSYVEIYFLILAIVAILDRQVFGKKQAQPTVEEAAATA